MVFEYPLYQSIVRAGSWQGYPAIDGAADDRRFLDSPGIVALKALGKAKQDSSGFVIRNSLNILKG